MPRVLAVAPALPRHVYRQEEISAALGPILTSTPAARRTMDRVHAHSGVRTRHLALPLDAYADLRSFGRANDLFLREGTALAEQAARRALAAAGLAPEDVDLVLLTSVTGIGAPSVDAALVPRLGLRTDVRRIPSFGLGCAGGAAGLGRVHDHLVGHPDHVALLVAVELCSLTLQRDDSTANLVSTGIFGDGAAAAVVVGDRRAGTAPGFDTVDVRSRLYPGTADALGWSVTDTGFRIVLSAGLPDHLRRHLGDDVPAFLDDHDLKVRDVATWVVHAGGPKVLEAVRESLDLDDGALAASWASLASVGNLSSASVLHVLASALGRTADEPGGPGLLMAFGPGVSLDMVLLRRAGGTSGGPARGRAPC